MSQNEKAKKKLNKKLFALNVVIVAAFLCLLFVIYGYLREALIATAASESYDEIKEQAVSVINEETGERSVDFTIINANGSTSTSWLYIPDTNIDYPLVQGPDNDTYLNMDAYGNTSDAGAIFINFANAADMSDPKTVIFGHNRSDGSMFTALHYYSDSEWGYEHEDAYIYMNNGSVKHYKLLYYIFTVPLNEAIYTTSKTEDVNEAATRLREEATIIYNEHMGGKLICLSTCTYHTKRTVVVFELIDESEPTIESSNYAGYLESLQEIEEDTDISSDGAVDSSAISSSEDGSTLESSAGAGSTETSADANESVSASSSSDGISDSSSVNVSFSNKN